jgi:hypothetical protein
LDTDTRKVTVVINVIFDERVLYKDMFGDAKVKAQVDSSSMPYIPSTLSYDALYNSVVTLPENDIRTTENPIFEPRIVSQTSITGSTSQPTTTATPCPTSAITTNNSERLSPVLPGPGVPTIQGPIPMHPAGQNTVELD